MLTDVALGRPPRRARTVGANAGPSAWSNTATVVRPVGAPDAPGISTGAWCDFDTPGVRARGDALRHAGLRFLGRTRTRHHEAPRQTSTTIRRNPDAPVQGRNLEILKKTKAADLAVAEALDLRHWKLHHLRIAVLREAGHQPRR